MKLLVKLYDKTLEWSQHRHAPRYLAAVSFVEASVFPIPPYFMLAPMAIARPDKAFNYALIGTIASVLGGILGYILGYFVFKPLMLPLIEAIDCIPIYTKALDLLQHYGFWAVMFAGFTPLPYKFVAIGAGFMQIALVPFIVASIFGRSVKFFLLATIIRLGGSRIEHLIRKLLHKAGFFMVCALAALIGCKTLGFI